MAIINKQNNIPITKIQEQFWIMNQFFPNSPVYNIPSAFIIRGNLNIEILEKSINEIIKRHSIFRTILDVNEIEPFQKVMPHQKQRINLINIQNIPSEGKEREMIRLLQDEISRPFNLKKGPLIRIQLLFLDKDHFALSITLHHSVIDLYSLELFSNELSTIYNSLKKKGTFQIKEPEYQYSDFAYWQNNLLNSSIFQEKENKWKEILNGHDGFLDFPTDKRRLAVQTLNGTALSVSLSRPQSEMVRQVSNELFLAPFAILLTIYYCLLSLYTKKTDLIVGIPYTNRKNIDHKNIMGCFMNVLPLRVKFNNSSTFHSIAKVIRKSMITAYSIQEVPFKEIVKLCPERRSEVNPCFQTAFTIKPPMQLHLNNLNITPYTVNSSENFILHPGGSQFDMFLTLWEEKNCYMGIIEYNSDLFEKRTIEYFWKNYSSFLEKSLHARGRPIVEIDFLSEDYFNIIADNTINSSVRQFNNMHNIHSLIEEQVKKTPEKIAVIFEKKCMTYHELNSHANKLAHYIQSFTKGKQQLIGININRSLDMVIAILGILKAGSAYVPLDSDFPENRLKYMIEQSNLSLICTQKDLSYNFKNKNLTTICLDGDWNTIDKQISKNPEITVSSDSLAYVIYTSGSTGKPKGVKITHKAVVNFLISMSKEPGISKDDVLLAITTISFDISVLELLLPLIVGAQVIIAKREIIFDGSLLIEAIEKFKPTFMQATPITWHILFSAGWKGATPFKALCGGEAMPGEIANKLVESVSSVWNMYGPTETTVWSACYQLTRVNQPVLIGKPIENTSIYILNENMKRVPIGASGEIYISGDGVSLGYLNKPDLTAKRFIKNFFDSSSQNIYKTGDFGRFLFDGNIEFYNRIDSQVKINGFRIELNEIDNVILSHNDISEAATVVKEKNNNKYLIVYFVPHSKDFQIRALKNYLKTQLPRYMIPSYYICLKKLPLISNGKIDRNFLLDIELKDIKLKNDITIPGSDLEKEICKIWEEVLQYNGISIDDNFFDLGGNSILSIEVIRLINERLNKKISVMDIFKYPTVSAICKYLNFNQDSKNKFSEKKFNEIKNRAKKQKQALKKGFKKI